MTQQVDPRSTAVHEQSDGFEFQSHGSSLGGYNTTSTNNANNTNNANSSSGGDGKENLEERWPSLLNVRQVVVAFIMETVSRSRPLQEKLNMVIVRAWHLYLAYARAYPLATAFLSCLVVLSAVPILIFASITGVSLGLLAGTATVIVIIIQSIIFCIAGAILLFVLGFIVILTLFTFFWLIVGYIAFQFVSTMYRSFKEQRLRHAQEERRKEQRVMEEEDAHEWEKKDTSVAAGAAPVTHERQL
ncbi:hypothetical protein BG015_003382 [Linnemannia schmuckeri]|uniref:Promethin n=1 Tax=Linnemannia schmuckeri TaxID=64567 RepID=A0A9P5S4S5_9FUNG|nr:hypothetical protein BG015_003382 [Linnemannia schmuckeri]